MFVVIVIVRCLLPAVFIFLIYRIREPDFLLPQGAYRLGKWKFIFNEFCQGYYTFDPEVQAAVSLSTVYNATRRIDTPGIGLLNPVGKCIYIDYNNVT